MSHTYILHISLLDSHITSLNCFEGDNPSVSSGPAISLGWEYSEIMTPTLDEYENTRGKRRSKIEMVMPRHIREQILKMECECSRADIAGCIREINHIKFQRRKTVHNLSSAKTEERLENFQRKLSEMICARKRVDAHIQEWWYANADQWKNE